MGAIHLKDWPLLHHFVSQDKSTDGKKSKKKVLDEDEDIDRKEELRAVLDANSIEGYLVLNSSCRPDFQGWTIKSVDFGISLLQESDKPLYQFRFAVDCPLSVVKERIESGTKIISYCLGLACSNDGEKQKYCRKLILESKWKFEECLSIVCALDDVELFRQLTGGKEEVSLKLLSILIKRCSSNIMAYILSFSKRSHFPANIKWNEIEHYQAKSIPAERVKKFLEVVDRKIMNFNGSELHRQLAIIAGTALNVNCTDDISDQTLSLIPVADRELVANYLIKKAGNVNFILPVHYNRWIIDFRKKISLITVKTSNINYPMCQNLIKLINSERSCVNIGRFEYPPTPYIALAMDIRSHPPFSYLPCNNGSQIIHQIKANNYSYIGHCVKDGKYYLMSNMDSIDSETQLSEEMMAFPLAADIQTDPSDCENAKWNWEDEETKPAVSDKKPVKLKT